MEGFCRRAPDATQPRRSPALHAREKFTAPSLRFESGTGTKTWLGEATSSVSQAEQFNLRDLDRVVPADILSDMKTSLRTFQREFGRMRRLASRGTAIRVQAKHETFVFAKEPSAHGLLGCCENLMDASKLTTEPVAGEWEAQR